jgi:hypothetical protein
MLLRGDSVNNDRFWETARYTFLRLRYAYNNVVTVGNGVFSMCFVPIFYNQDSWNGE